MSKKKRKNKNRKTPKQALSAVTGQAKKQEVEKPVAVLDVRPDLKKTAILTAVCLVILFLLYLP